MMALKRIGRALLFGPGIVLTAPATLAHEATHLAVGWPWIDRVHEWRLYEMSADVEWKPMPRWARYASAFAPTVLGLLMALATGIALWGSGYSSAQRDWLQWTVILAYWIQFVWPGPGDRAAVDATPGGSDDAT